MCALHSVCNTHQEHGLSLSCVCFTCQWCLQHAWAGHAGHCFQPGWSEEVISDALSCIACSKGHLIALDIVRGLVFLHSNKVVHADLKAKNVLLTQNAGEPNFHMNQMFCHWLCATCHHMVHPVGCSAHANMVMFSSSFSHFCCRKSHCHLSFSFLDRALPLHLMYPHRLS